MWPFSKKENQGELSLVFDIGSSSLGCSVFKIENSGNPFILYSNREPILVQENLDFESFLTLTLSTLDKLVEKVHSEKFGRIDRVFCVLSSPWFHSQTTNIKFEKNTPFIFNNKFADDLINKEVELLLKKYKQEGNSNTNILPIEMKTMSINLNGYNVKNPLNHKATSLEMPIFVSLSEEFFIKEIEKIINKAFHYKSIKFSSFLIASFTVARDMFINQDKFLLVNIGGEITDISMIKKDILRDNTSFPMGVNFLVRGIVKSLKVDASEARSLLHLYKDNHTNTENTKRLEVAIEPLKRTWLKNFQESLNNLSHDISIPSTIFITVDQNLAEFFSQIIKEEELNQYSLAESKFRIVFLGTEALHGIALFDEKKHIERDPLLIIESIYINRFLK